MDMKFRADDKDLYNLVVCRSRSQISTEIDGETVILNVGMGTYNGLDLIGTRIWQQIEIPTTIGSVVQFLISEYEVSEKQCVMDLCCFLNQLADSGIISEISK